MQKITFARRLRNKQICELKFRRQQSLGRYIVDFICLEKKLVIELDGSQHMSDQGKRYDEIRTNWLQQEGFLVIRFWDNALLRNIDICLEKIYLTLNPSPLNGEGDSN